MSQTLAQRRVLTTVVRPGDPAVPAASAAPAVSSGRRAPGVAVPDRAVSWSGAAGRAVLTLVRAGARVIEVGPDRVRLRRAGRDCEVDPRGRVDWSPPR
jgi:hypothetical protein